MNRDKKVYIGMTEAEYKTIQAKADNLGQTVSAYLRLLGLTQTPLT